MVRKAILQFGDATYSKISLQLLGQTPSKSSLKVMYGNTNTAVLQEARVQYLVLFVVGAAPTHTPTCKQNSRAFFSAHFLELHTFLEKDLYELNFATFFGDFHLDILLMFFPASRSVHKVFPRIPASNGWMMSGALCLRKDDEPSNETVRCVAWATSVASQVLGRFGSFSKAVRFVQGPSGSKDPSG